MASSLFPTIQFFDDAGAVLNGGLIYHYEPGTTTDKDVYPTLADADVASGNESAQPVVLDSAGRPPSEGIWMTGLTKIVVKNSAGTTIKTYDSAGDGSGTNAMPKNHIAGLTLSLDADTDHDINVTAGEARDAADSEDMALAGEITKQIDAGIWAVGDDAAGMDTADAITADTMYYAWLIKRTDTGVVDVLVSASSTAPTMPTSYDKKRLIGAVLTDGTTPGNLIGFTQVGDYFRYTGDVIADVSDTTITSDAFETAALSVPPSSEAMIYGSTDGSTGVTQMRLTVRTAGAADAAAAFESASISEHAAGADTIRAGGFIAVLVDSSSQVNYAALESAGTVNVRIHTLGYRMLTRRNP